MSGVITDWDRDNLLWDFSRINVKPEVSSVLELIAESHEISAEEKELVKKYKTGVNVWIFNYSGSLMSYLRRDIDNFPENCRTAGVRYVVQKTSHRYFEDIRNSIVLADKYSGLHIQGLFETTEYLRMLNDHFYQKHTIVPKMKRLQIN